MCPVLFGLIFKRSAWWSASVGALLAIAFALLVDYSYKVVGWFGHEMDSMAFYNWFYGTYFHRTVGDKLIDTVAVKNSFQIVIVFLTFLISIPFATKKDLERPERIQFEKNLKTPVNYEESGDPKKGYWIFRPLGVITLIIGIFLFVILPVQMIFPVKDLPLTGYQTFMWVLIAGAFCFLGGLMMYAAKGTLPSNTEDNMDSQSNINK
jgi:hypothetical protein